MDAISFRNQVIRDYEQFARSFTGPQNVMSEGCPSVTFPPLKCKELAKLGECRMQVRGVAAFDQLSNCGAAKAC